MFRQLAAILCLLGATLPFVQAELNLRTRYDEEGAMILQLEREEEYSRQEYENITEVYEEYGNEEPIYDKIDMCHGDCDTSEDCEDGLFCYHRDLDDPLVPGCTNDDNPDLSSTNSVCVAQLPEDAVERTSPIRSGRNLLGLCGGDCDSDRDCDGSLVCHQRNRGQAVPGCRGKSLASSRDYCVRSSSGGGQSSSKIGECRGDCNSNSDCSGDLVCKQRNAYDPIPSGCRGRISSSMDYCVKPGSTGVVTGGGNTGGGNTGGASSTPATTTSGSFRLKIYWEPGYDWQEQYFETYWCLTRDYNVGGTCWAGLQRQTCAGNRVYVTKCSSSSKQQWQFQSVGDEVMIKASGTNRCLQRTGIHVIVTTCNANSSMQRFFAPRGSLNGYRFELSQKSASRYCLNQDHHPKQAEYVQMFPCTWTRARDSLTSYWVKY